MKFPWHKYEEKPLGRRNTLQVFITNRCNLRCKGCFARNVMGERDQDISMLEYSRLIRDTPAADQINFLGGEPLMYKHLREALAYNEVIGVKTTIYTNGTLLDKIEDIPLLTHYPKYRVSIYNYDGKIKSTLSIPKSAVPFEANYMVSSTTVVDDMLKSAEYLEAHHDCKVFFISSLRELDNPRQEFFDDTALTMPVLRYKELVHDFLDRYEGRLEIHVSKRGVFESTTTLPDRKCRFANYFIGGKIIQCPYDIVNCKFQEDFKFNARNCQHNSTCLMSKVKYKPLN